MSSYPKGHVLHGLTNDQITMTALVGLDYDHQLVGVIDDQHNERLWYTDRAPSALAAALVLAEGLANQLAASQEETRRLQYQLDRIANQPGVVVPV